MNPRDEKILLTIEKKQRYDYENLVPFCVVQKSFPWVDGTELTSDLLKLNENDYLWKIINPVSQMGWWYGLTSLGKRECERIKHDNTEAKRNRSIQIVSTIIGTLLGFFLGKFL